MDALKARLEQEIGSIESLIPCHGGDISRAYHVKTNEGSHFFLKVNTRERLSMFEAEADGLQTLRELTPFRVPKVIDTFSAHDHSGILMEWIEASQPDEKSWDQFWSFLGEMHSQKSEKFGFYRDGFIGPLEQQNDEDTSWIEFWIERRISPLVAQAMEKGHLKQKEMMPFLLLFDKVRTHLGQHPFEPRLVHGDLWKGNLIFDEAGIPTVIDPSVHYAWPEMELAFIDLFGGFEKIGKNRYQPRDNHNFLGDNYWHLWQIYPLLVHTILFGGMYQRRLITTVDHALQLF
jgi:protein-ribulosamine 3-kinase